MNRRSFRLLRIACSHPYARNYLLVCPVGFVCHCHAGNSGVGGSRIYWEHTLVGLVDCGGDGHGQEGKL